jgi:hypothetical protein
MRRRIAKVPTPENVYGCRWLLLEYDTKSGGWFLYFHRTLGELSEAENWYLSDEQALSQAEKWGIRRIDWEEVPEGEPLS